MDFSFSEEQQMLRDSVRSFVSKEFDEARVVEVAERDAGWPDPRTAADELAWQQIAELGWLGLSAPEASGGAGMTFLDEAVVLEELANALYPGPYFSTVVLALPALEAAPDLLAPVIAGEHAATFAWAEEGEPHDLASAGGAATAEESDEGWVLTGTKRLVPDATAAGLIVVGATSARGVGLWAVDATRDEVTARATSTMDATRRFGEVTLTSAPATLLVAPGEADEVLRRIRQRASAACAVEAAGIGQKALDLAQRHAQEREQFGKPIGSYQAVAHQVSDTYMGVELARSLAYWACWCVAEADPQAEVAAAAAKAFATEAAVEACERSIQVHGGIGFTWEHILQRYYKRAQWLQAFDGYGRVQRQVVAASLLGAPVQ